MEKYTVTVKATKTITIQEEHNYLCTTMDEALDFIDEKSENSHNTTVSITEVKITKF